MKRGKNTTEARPVLRAKTYWTEEFGAHQYAFNLGTGEECRFAGGGTTGGVVTDAEYMLVYAYLKDDPQRFYEFNNATLMRTLDEFVERFRDQIILSNSGATIALGDWCVMLDVPAAVMADEHDDDGDLNGWITELIGGAQ